MITKMEQLVDYAARSHGLPRQSCEIGRWSLLSLSHRSLPKEERPAERHRWGGNRQGRLLPRHLREGSLISTYGLLQEARSCANALFYGSFVHLPHTVQQLFAPFYWWGNNESEGLWACPELHSPWLWGPGPCHQSSMWTIKQECSPLYGSQPLLLV